MASTIKILSIFGTVLVFVIFMIKQFKFEEVTRIRYIIIPVFAFIQFTTNIKLENVTDMLVFSIILIMGILVGIYQTKSFKIVLKEEETRYFVQMDDGEQHPMMEKVYYSKGGRTYLNGWIIVFVFQLFIPVLFYQNSLVSDEVVTELVKEITEDMLVFLRFWDSSPWWVWELYAVSSLSYYISLCIQHTDFKVAIHQK